MNLIKCVFNMVLLRRLPMSTFSVKILGEKAFNTAQQPKYDEYQRGIASMVYKVFDEKSAFLRENIPASAYTSSGAF